MDPCITQLKAQGPSRTCDKSKEEETGLDHAIEGKGAALLEPRAERLELRRIRVVRPLSVKGRWSLYVP